MHRMTLSDPKPGQYFIRSHMEQLARSDYLLSVCFFIISHIVPLKQHIAIAQIPSAEPPTHELKKRENKTTVVLRHILLALFFIFMLGFSWLVGFFTVFFPRTF